MDVLYVIGQGAEHDDLELKMSLRSLERYGGHLGRVIVCGRIPDWLSDEAVKIPADDNALGGPKHANMLRKVFLAVDAGAVSGDFLFSADDHFLVKPVDLDAFPFFYRREKIRTREEFHRERPGGHWSDYKECLAKTRELLERNGYYPREWIGHVNARFNTADAQEVKRLMEEGLKMRMPFGPEPICLFMSVRDKREPITPTYRHDLKATLLPSPKNFPAFIRDNIAFSTGTTISDRAGRFTNFMRSLYPQKSRFERWDLR